VREGGCDFPNKPDGFSGSVCGDKYISCEEIARHREVLTTNKDPVVISEAVGKIRRFQARLSTADFGSQATG